MPVPGERNRLTGICLFWAYPHLLSWKYKTECDGKAEKAYGWVRREGVPVVVVAVFLVI